MVMLDPEKTYSISYNVTKSQVLNNIDIIPNQRIVNGLEKKQTHPKVTRLTFAHP